jgi:hypothetical protein
MDASSEGGNVPQVPRARQLARRDQAARVAAEVASTT